MTDPDLSTQVVHVTDAKGVKRAHRPTCKRALASGPFETTAFTAVNLHGAVAATCCKPRLPEPQPPVVTDTAAEDRLERNRLARVEHAALREWYQAGAKGERPATPNLDALNLAYAAGPPAPSVRQRATRQVAVGDTGASGKAAPGAFLLAVLEMVQDQPTPAGGWGASALDKVLGRHNSGAIANALERLYSQGKVARVNDHPRRYAPLAKAAAAA